MMNIFNKCPFKVFNVYTVVTASSAVSIKSHGTVDNKTGAAGKTQGLNSATRQFFMLRIVPSDCPGMNYCPVKETCPNPYSFLRYTNDIMA